MNYVRQEVKMPDSFSDFSKPQSLLTLLVCAAAAVLFAFVTGECWPRIQYAGDPLNFPMSASVFYAFCLIAYLAQGAAFVLIARHPQKLTFDLGVMLFGAQFVTGLLWLGVFFGLELFGVALAVILVTLLLLFATFAAFKPINVKAACLLAPYGCLIAFAGFLNIWFFLGRQVFDAA